VAQILVVVGTRPEIVKMAPVVRALQEKDVNFTFVHTGQHYEADHISDLLFAPTETVKKTLKMNRFMERFMLLETRLWTLLLSTCLWLKKNLM